MSAEQQIAKRFALSGRCDNGLHSECPYPDKCKCSCHGETAPEATPPDLVEKALTAAYHALRGYQYGNGDPTSAEETADYVHNALELYKLNTPADSIDTLKRRVAELEARDRLWNSAFGTSQLTHAKARLESAESKLERSERRVETLEKALEIARRLTVAPSGVNLCACRNVNAVKSGMEKPCGYCEFRAALQGEQP